MRRFCAVSILVVCLLILVAGCGPTLEAEKTTPGTTTPPGETFAVGDTVSISNYRITVNKARTSTGTEFFKPASGYVWLIVECMLENTHATDPLAVSSLMMFELVDKDGRAMEGAFLADTKGKLDGELGAGRKMTGEIAWEVPVGTKGLELLFKPELFQAGQAIFKLGDL